MSVDAAVAPPISRQEDAAPAVAYVPAFKRDPDQARTDRIDLLFVIDDAGSMGDKQALLGRAIPDMVERLTHPQCVRDDGTPVADQPDDVAAPCPENSGREFSVVQDMHIGVVTSSVGSAGVCLGDFGEAGRGHLVELQGATGYPAQGFLAWDPGAVKQPPGQHDLIELSADVGELVRHGQTGCADEASLEAFYRLLIEPDPHLGVQAVDCEPGSGALDCIEPHGLDEALLAQRGRFLRPDSLVAIILLSDENDCSVAPVADAQRFLAGRTPMPRATQACADDPYDPCCQPCDGPPRAGCPPLTADPNCSRGRYEESEDPLGLRCWDPKRRFGKDYRHPVERYIDGLTRLRVRNRAGERVPNPLYYASGDAGADPRSPTLVFFAAIVGVPWQDLATDPDDPDRLEYFAGAELEDAGVWRRVLGDPLRGVPPEDPLMLESVAERQGVHPITGDALAPSSARDRAANPINGHEMSLQEAAGGLRSELQYACIFELPSARECERPIGCDCIGGDHAQTHDPVCQRLDGSYSNIQWAAKAYPAVRQLQVLKGIGDNAIAASICARNTVDADRSDFGYRPALKALVDRLRVGLN